MRGQACRKCAAIGHFRVKCPQLYQQGGAQSGFKMLVDLVKVDVDAED